MRRRGRHDRRDRVAPADSARRVPRSRPTACWPGSTSRSRRSGSWTPTVKIDGPEARRRSCRRATRSPKLVGPARALLVGERTALNFLQRLSGIATLHAAVRGRRRRRAITILDTRKTTPTLRALEKYAVRAAARTNHRNGLFDARPDQGQSHPPGRRREAAAVQRARVQHRPDCRSRSKRRRWPKSTRRSPPGPTSILVDNMSIDGHPRRRSTARAAARRSRSPAA